MLLLSLLAGCNPARSFDEHLQAIAGPYRFHLVNWEFRALIGEAGGFFSGKHEAADNSTLPVIEYFTNVARVKGLESEIEAVRAGSRQGDLAGLADKLAELQRRNAGLSPAVEKRLEVQIREAFSRLGIFNPVDRYIRLRAGFPPVSINLGRPPHLLVVSSRGRIASIREVTLLPEMSLKDMERIEAEVDGLGVSSLVVDLGGLSTYPSYVSDRGDIRFTLETVVHEWLHAYLAFTPLGFRYVLDLTGIRPDYDITTINETVASMVSKEIGAMIYRDYYAPGETDSTAPEAAAAGFDFNRQMREIRKAVDDYLARGEIDQAEKFMEQQRQYLAANGYYIRKLNQAYFAFYGTYADSPTSISPIGAQLKQLRNKSASLKEFLDTVSTMTGTRDLAAGVR
jgi:hypothetical protein